jgi:hypothetical protein
MPAWRNLRSALPRPEVAAILRSLPEDGPATCLKFLAASDENIKPERIKLEQTWTNDFARRANETLR